MVLADAATQVRYSWNLLRAGPLRLDGGSMFGVVPRAVWNRTVQCDEQGRIELAHNCLLLEPVSASERIEPVGATPASPSPGIETRATQPSPLPEHRVLIE